MFKIEANSKLLFMGDSITDAGRTRPNGEGLFDPYGSGYVSFVNALINSTYTNNQVRVVNKGVSGDTTRKLIERWQEDCLDQKPDWLVIMIGINDVWRTLDLPLFPEEHIYVEEYEENLRKMLDSVQGKIKNVVLMSPYFIELNKQDEMRKRMDQYGQVVKKLAQEYKTMFVDVQAAFDEFLQAHHPAYISWDRIHPNNIGHMIIAKVFLKEVGFEF